MALRQREPGPAAVDLAALHRSADEEHRIGVAVIGAAVAVFRDRAAELRHRQDHDVLHPRAEVGGERGDPLREVVEAIGQLAGGGALVGMVIPLRRLGERDLQPDVGLGELCDLLQRLAVGGARIDCAVLGLVAAGRRGVELAHRVEGVAGQCAAEHAVRGRRILGLERRLCAGAAADAEAVDVRHRQRRRGALQRPRQLRGQRHRAKRRRAARRSARSTRFSQPSARALHARACRSPCSPARRNASASDRAIRRRGRWPGIAAARAAGAAPGAGAGRRTRPGRGPRPHVPPPGWAIAIVGRAV